MMLSGSRPLATITPRWRSIGDIHLLQLPAQDAEKRILSAHHRRITHELLESFQKPGEIGNVVVRLCDGPEKARQMPELIAISAAARDQMIFCQLWTLCKFIRGIGRAKFQVCNPRNSTTVPPCRCLRAS